MAEYQITPYIVTLYPARQKSSPMQMGRVRPGKPELSVVDAFAKTFSVLQQEDKPRKRANDRNRKLNVRKVKLAQNQVEVTCSLGVAGYTSRVSLKELGISNAKRDTSDFEWFDLRAVFAAIPTARAGILLVEGVGNFGMVTHLSELIKLGFRANVPDTTFEIKPIQDAQSWGETFAALTTQAIEFHSADGGGKAVPLKKVIKVSRSGGLGPYSGVVGGIVNTCGSACFRRPPFQLIRSVPSPPTG